MDIVGGPLFRSRRSTILWLRWLLLSALSYLLLFQSGQFETTWPTSIIILLLVASNVVLMALPTRLFDLRWFDGILLVADVLLVSFAMTTTQLSSGYLLFFFFLIILMTALGKGTGAVVTNGIVVVGVYVLYVLHYYLDDAQLDVGTLLNIPFLVICTIFFTVLVHQERVKQNRALEQSRKKLRANQEQLLSLAAKLSLAEERERRQIATELRDNVGQTMAMIKIKTSALQKQAASTSLSLPLDEVRKLAEQTISFIRSLTDELSPPVLYELGFEAAVEWLVEKHRKRHGIRVELYNDGKPKPLDDDVRVMLFQSVRELLTNVAKHSRAEEVRIILKTEGDRMRVMVEDDGEGFNPSKMSAVDKIGLSSISERLSSAGGRFSLQSEPGRGTRVTLEARLNACRGS
jgi:signal transduction histidine kinase